MTYSVFASPFGSVGILTDEVQVLGIDLLTDQKPSGRPTPVALLALDELKEYFDGKRHHFTVPFALKGTPFKQAVLRAMMEIPYGETVSYHDLAVRVGNPKANRAVGTACATNDIPLLIPCHRVIKSDGSIGGFAARPDFKQQLLDLEKAHR